jgi:trk system potassium uptake protein TrkH
MQKSLAPKLTYTGIIALGFLGIILFGALLLALPVSSRSGEWTPFINSLFTATSATCVTGLVVYDTFTHWSLFGQIVILLLIQVGGLGFMTIITMMLVFLKKRITLRERLVIRQSAGSINVGGVVLLVKKVAWGTLLFEGTGAVLLAFRFCPEMGFWRGAYNAIFHSVSAFCNAGIDIWENTANILL